MILDFYYCLDEIWWGLSISERTADLGQSIEDIDLAFILWLHVFGMGI